MSSRRGDDRLRCPQDGSDEMICRVDPGSAQLRSPGRSSCRWSRPARVTPPNSALVRLPLRAAPGDPQRRGQSQGEPEVTAQLEPSRDQQSLGAGSAADQAQKCHGFKLERQRRPTSIPSRSLAPAVGEHEPVAVDAAVPAAGDPELHDRVDSCIGLCALTDRTKDLPQQEATNPAAHDRLKSWVRSRAHPTSKRLRLEISKPASASLSLLTSGSAGQRVHSLCLGRRSTEG